MCVRVCAHVGVDVGMGESSVGKLGLDSLILKMITHPGVETLPSSMHSGIHMVSPPDTMAINGVVARTQAPCSPPFASFCSGLHC